MSSISYATSAAPAVDPQDGATQLVTGGDTESFWLHMMIVSFNIGVTQSMFEGKNWPQHARNFERILRKFHTAGAGIICCSELGGHQKGINKATGVDFANLVATCCPNFAIVSEGAYASI